ncbi:MAG: PIG-L family deacetylase [Candidatus Schekmanbacteria bacterium]|nr:MAG: PIG-L family deacetylase [Candidatus Schekmanbacteria bacterium]
MKILAIGSHPDDIEVGCGGTLKKYAQKGDEIYYLIMTMGEQGGDPQVRKKEQEEAARIMGVKKIFWGGLEDTKIDSRLSTIQKVESVIKEVKPVFTFTHYYNDTHQDHRHLSNAVISAARYAKNVLFYEGPTTQDFSPTIFSDIEKVLDIKIALVKAHASQVMRTNIAGISIEDIVLSTANFRGTLARVKYAEGFVPLRVFINISEE